MINPSFNQPYCHARQKNKQSGVALIIFTLVILLAGTAILFSVLDSNSIKIERDRKTAAALAEAKAALIGWSAAHPDLPGMMPFPDRSGDGDYDGTSDCYLPSVNFAYKFLFGQLPLKSVLDNVSSGGCTPYFTGPDLDVRDGDGERLWYAVSRNLVREYHSPATDPVINPGIINTPTNPWMIVRDKNGQVISDRVAVVIIAPGTPVGSQDRSGGLEEASEYLDSFQIGAVTYSNTDYDNSDEDFVMGEDMHNVPDSDTTYQHPYYFNDKLIYITIDELMAMVEKRAAQEAAFQLRSYYAASSGTAANRFYPYAAILGDTDNACVVNNLTGGLPIASSSTSASASCTSGHACSTSFSLTQVKFTRPVSDAYTSATGSCTLAGNTCTCTGAGSCVKSGPPSHTFTCDADGNCSSTGAQPNGSFTFTYTPQSPDATTTSGSCTGGNGSVTCTGSGSFSSSNCGHPNPGLATLPGWFTDNRWQDFMYYAISTDCNYAAPGCVSGSLTVGTKANTHALVTSAGRILGTQSRPSANIADYLDSAENTDNDSVFDAVGTTRSSTYNDQMFIVAPK